MLSSREDSTRKETISQNRFLTAVEARISRRVEINSGRRGKKRKKSFHFVGDPLHRLSSFEHLACELHAMDMIATSQVRVLGARVPIASALISSALTLPRSFPRCVLAAAKLGRCLSGLPGCGPQEYGGLGAGRREGGSRASRRPVSHASDPPDSALGWSAARCSYTLQETVLRGTA